jgi:hypothetical protein
MGNNEVSPVATRTGQVVGGKATTLPCAGANFTSLAIDRDISLSAWASTQASPRTATGSTA